MSTEASARGIALPAAAVVIAACACGCSGGGPSSGARSTADAGEQDSTFSADATGIADDATADRNEDGEAASEQPGPGEAGPGDAGATDAAAVGDGGWVLVWSD